MTKKIMLNQTIWIEQRQVAFVYLPKVACTSWKLFFAYALNLTFPENLDYEQVHHPIIFPLPYVGGMMDEAQERFLLQLESGKIQLYAMVRNPRQRILSAYLDKIALHCPPGSFFDYNVIPAIQLWAGLDSGQCPSFEQFLGWINTDDSMFTQDNHWMPMVDLLGLTGFDSISVQKYSKIWTMEDINVASDHFCQILSVDFSFPDNQTLGPRHNLTSSVDLIAKYFTPTAESLFQSHFNADLDLYENLISQRRI